MDLKAYYRKLREIEMAISDEYPVVVSQDTADGGRAGVRNEVHRTVAARMILEGKARLATREEAEEFRAEVVEARRQAEQAAAASRVQVTVIPEAELRALRNALRQSKG